VCRSAGPSAVAGNLEFDARALEPALLALKVDLEREAFILTDAVQRDARVTFGAARDSNEHGTGRGQRTQRHVAYLDAVIDRATRPALSITPMRTM